MRKINILKHGDVPNLKRIKQRNKEIRLHIYILNSGNTLTIVEKQTKPIWTIIPF